MKKKLILLTSVASVLILGLIIQIYRTRDNLLPLPYFFEGQFSQEELSKISQSHILIIGDQGGANLETYQKALIEALSKNLKSEISLYNWSMKHEGMHRTLNKIKTLKKLPRIIIYMGGSEEFYEKRLQITDKDALLDNIKTYEDEFNQTLLQLFPSLSKLLYKPLQYHKLSVNLLHPREDSVNGVVSLQTLESTYALYSLEIRAMAEYIRENNSQLVIITPPINLELRPAQPCPEAITPAIEGIQAEIDALITSKQIKEAFIKSKELLSITYSNALTWYLFGITALETTDRETARDALSKATAYDCGQAQGNIVFNTQMLAIAKANLFPVIDFHKMISSELGHNELFLDDKTPQPIFYEKLIVELTQVLKEQLKI